MAKRLSDKEVFLVADELEVNGKKFFTDKTYLAHCRPVQTMDKQVIIHLVDDTVRARNNFMLLRSDAAPYMMVAGTILKQLYPNLFHVTCIAHLLYNRAEKVRTRFPNVDAVIARVKAATVKNCDHRNRFCPIGHPPQPIITRRDNWLNAAFYYADYPPQVHEIVSTFQGSGLLVSRAQDTLANEIIGEDLVAIRLEYSELSRLVLEVEDPAYSLKKAHADLQQLQFGEDGALKEHLAKKDK